MQEEVTQKTIAFSIKSAKLTIQVLQAAARKFLETQNKGKTKLHHGQQSLKQLKKHGAALSNIEITDANIGLFTTERCFWPIPAGSTSTTAWRKGADGVT